MTCDRCHGAGLVPFLAAHYPPATARFLAAGARQDRDGNRWLVCPRCNGKGYTLGQRPPKEEPPHAP